MCIVALTSACWTDWGTWCPIVPVSHGRPVVFELVTSLVLRLQRATYVRKVGYYYRNLEVFGHIALRVPQYQACPSFAPLRVDHASNQSITSKKSTKSNVF